MVELYNEIYTKGWYWVCWCVLAVSLLDCSMAVMSDTCSTGDSFL